MLGWAILGYVLFMGVILTIHEYGHFIVARAFGIRIARFSIGIGTIMWRRPSTRAGEWALSSLPIGGYVKWATPGDTAHVSTGTRYFEESPASVRLLVALAGPAANLLTAVISLTLAMSLREEAVAPILGPPPAGSMLDQVGVHGGDRVVTINGRPIFDFADIGLHNTTSALLGRPNRWIFEREGKEFHFVLPPASLEALRTRSIPVEVGVADQRRIGPPRVKDVQSTSNPLQADDLIVAVDGIPVPTITDLQDQLFGKVGKTAQVEVERGNTRRTFAMRISQHPNRGPGTGALGIEVQLPAVNRIDYVSVGPQLVGESFRRCLDYVQVSFAAIYHLVAGHIGVNAMSGPAQIAHISGQTVKQFTLHIDPAPVLFFAAILSIGIAAFNLLPIPVLDGGVAIIALIEMLFQRRLPERAAQAIRFTGLALLGVFFIAAFMSDYEWFINL